MKRGQPGNTEKEACVDAEKRLPDRPNLRHLKLQAGDLRNALASGDVDALDRLKRVQPLSAIAGLPDPKLTVTESLLVIAREYGYPSWRALKQFVETRPSAAEPAMASKEAVLMNTVTESTAKTTTAKKATRRGRAKPVRIAVEGDWSPPLREVDIIERNSDIPHDILPGMLQQLDLKVNRREGYRFEDFKNLLRGRGLSAPVVIMKVKGPGGGSHGIFLGDRRNYGNDETAAIAGTGTMTPREIADMARFRGRVVVCLGSGLGTPQMAGAFIKAGASAYIGSTAPDRGKPAERLFFALRFFFELSQHGASVKEAWARARGLGKDASRFRLFVPRIRAGKTKAVMVPAPAMPAGFLAAYKAGKAFGNAGWKPPVAEVDIVSVEGWPCEIIRSIWAVLDQLGVRVNLHPCRSDEELKRCLAGRGLNAPLVLVESHGGPDKTGKNGIVLGEDHKGKKLEARILDVAEMGRLIRLPGRVLIATGCGLGSPETAKSFLKGGLKAHIGAIKPVNVCAGILFIYQFYYELAANGATVRQAFERARLANDQTRLFRLYPGEQSSPSTKAPDGFGAGGEKVRSDTPKPRPVLAAPALIEGFEGDTPNHYEGNWDVGFFDLRPAFALSAPGGRERYAYKLNFDYSKKAWPAVEILLPKGGQRWTGARGLSLDVYVPHDMPLARPLKCLFCVVGEKHEFSRPDLVLSRGWNHVVLPFDSTDWRGKPVGTKDSHQEAFDLEKLSPVKWFWIAFPGEGRREEGSVYLDNLRLE